MSVFAHVGLNINFRDHLIVKRLITHEIRVEDRSIIRR